MNNNFYDQQNGYSYNEPINFDSVNSSDEQYKKTYLELQKEKKNLSRIGLGFALFSVIAFATSFIISFLVIMINPEIYNSIIFLNALTPICLYLFALPILLLVISPCKATPPKKRKMSLKKWLVIFVVSYGIMYIGSFIGNFVMSFLSAMMNYDYSNGLNAIIDGKTIWVSAIFTVIVAPIGEEFVFRKLIIDRTHKYGPVVSIGLSALMFGLMHGNFYQFFYCFALGIVLGYIYYTTGNLFLSIALHAAINFLGGVVTTLLQPTLDNLANLNGTESMLSFISDNIIGLIVLAALMMFMLTSILCAIIVPIIFRRQITAERGSNELPRGHVFDTLIINGGILFMFVTYLLEFGLNLIPF